MPNFRKLLRPTPRSNIVHNVGVQQVEMAHRRDTKDGKFPVPFGLTDADRVKMLHKGAEHLLEAQRLRRQEAQSTDSNNE